MHNSTKGQSITLRALPLAPYLASTFVDHTMTDITSAHRLWCTDLHSHASTVGPSVFVENACHTAFALSVRFHLPQGCDRSRKIKITILKIISRWKSDTEVWTENQSLDATRPFPHWNTHETQREEPESFANTPRYLCTWPHSSMDQRQELSNVKTPRVISNHVPKNGAKTGFALRACSPFVLFKNLQLQPVTTQERSELPLISNPKHPMRF